MKHGKVYQIIEEEFDNRLGLAIILNILTNWIEKIREGPLPKEGLERKAIKCEKRIVSECSDLEILRYIVGELAPILKIERGNDHVK